MSKLLFVPGQRWVSNTESEAGLGIVVESAHRRVTISFPAIGEQRVYAVDNAPLSRVQYNVDDSVRDSDGKVYTVTQVHEQASRFAYDCIDEQGNEQFLDELDLDSFVQFSKPHDRLFSGQVDKFARFALRREALDNIRSLHQSETNGLQGARVQLLPHQFYIANEVSSRHAPRVLLADEVGLGKTIEAGLILHQQLISGKVSRVLVVVPDSLVHQWLVEMLRRFNLRFTILDEQRCQSLEGLDLESIDDLDELEELNDVNPFDSAQLVICSLSLLANSQKRAEQALDAGWDMMIVDEAHHLHWSEAKVSDEYRCIETLAEQIPALLLLTATPEQLGIESHFARLRLLDPARYHDINLYKDEEANYKQVSELVECLLAEDALHQLQGSEQLVAQLGSYLGQIEADKFQALLDQNPSDDDFAEAVDALVRSLIDRHGTGRVLFRNTRDAVTGFPERKFNPHPLPTPEAYLSALSSDNEYGPKHLLQAEQVLGESWIATDPRVTWLVNWLANLTDEDGWEDKALVICANAQTAKQLEDHLNLRSGFRSAVFHEGMSLVARDRAAAYFAEEEGECAQVLVCSEIGSEGRNFQFARHIVLFDLPLNPDLLEQRIGRLDRIGQRNTVQIHVPFYDQGAQQTLVQWYHQGLNAFERVCPVGSAVYEQLEDELLNCLFDVSSQNVEPLVTKAHDLTEAALQTLQNGRDKLLELSSCNTDRAEHLIADLGASANPQLLEEFMVKVYDQFGVDHSFHSANALVIQASDNLQCDSFPGLLDDGMTVTFNRNKALSREDIHFLSWEHPMVSGALDMITGGDFGNATICTMKLPPLKPGNLLLESHFVLHCPAPKALQIHRFIPMAGLRIVVDNNGKDFSQVITGLHFDKLGNKIAKGMVHDVIRHARPKITNMVKQAEKLSLAQSDHADIIDQALAKMHQHQDIELQRLKALARVNPSIRQEEIDYVVQTTELLQNTIEKAEWCLDSIRVAVTV